MSLQIPSDGELLSAIRLGDETSFRSLYDRYWAVMFNNAYLAIQDKEEAGSIVNDIFMGIWRNRHTVQIISMPNYLKAATRYRVYSYLKEKVKKKSSVLYIENYGELDQSKLISYNYQSNISQDIVEQLEHLLANLPKKCQEIFLLSRVTHLSNSEIAAKLDISKRTVENQISLALKYFRRHFSNLTILFLLLFSH